MTVQQPGGAGTSVTVASGSIGVTSLPAIPAGSNVIGHVIVDSLPSNLTQPAVSTTRVVNGAGVSLVAAVTAKVVYVVGCVIVASVATSFKFQTSTGPADISANWPLAANGGFTWGPTGSGTVLCATALGDGLLATSGGSVAVHLLYVQQ